MDLHKLLRSLTPQIYASLCRAIELGRWPDGRSLTAEQRALCLQAVIAYDAEHKPVSERVGYLPPKVKSAAGVKSATGGAGAIRADDGGETVGENPGAGQPLQWRH